MKSMLSVFILLMSLTQAMAGEFCSQEKLNAIKLGSPVLITQAQNFYRQNIKRIQLADIKVRASQKEVERALEKNELFRKMVESKKLEAEAMTRLEHYDNAMKALDDVKFLREKADKRAAQIAQADEILKRASDSILEKISEIRLDPCYVALDDGSKVAANRKGHRSHASVK